MADTVSLQAEDFTKKRGWYTLYLPDDSTAQMVSDIRDLLVPMTSAIPFRATQMMERVNLPPLGLISSTGQVDKICRLTFTTATGFAHVDVLAPVPACFNPDGTVDEDFQPVADVIAWLLANAVSREGDPLLTFSQGNLLGQQPGAVAINGAAAIVKRGAMVADFWPQDGADIHVGEIDQ